MQGYTAWYGHILAPQHLIRGEVFLFFFFHDDVDSRNIINNNNNNINPVDNINNVIENSENNIKMLNM